MVRGFTGSGFTGSRVHRFGVHRFGVHRFGGSQVEAAGIRRGASGAGDEVPQPDAGMSRISQDSAPRAGHPACVRARVIPQQREDPVLSPPSGTPGYLPARNVRGIVDVGRDVERGAARISIGVMSAF